MFAKREKKGKKNKSASRTHCKNHRQSGLVVDDCRIFQVEKKCCQSEAEKAERAGVGELLLPLRSHLCWCVCVQEAWRIPSLQESMLFLLHCVRESKVRARGAVPVVVKDHCALIYL